MSRTVKGVLWLLASNVATKLLWAASIVLLMRLLGPDSYGALATIWAFSGLIAGISDMGASQAMLREGSRSGHKLRPYLLSALTVKTALLIPVWIGVMAACLVWLPAPSDNVQGWALAVVLAAATPLIDHFQTVLSQVVQVLHRLDVFSIWRSVYYVGLLASLWIVLTLHNTPLAASAVYFGATVLFTVLFVWRVFMFLPRLSPEAPALYPLRKAITEGGPFLLTTVLMLAYYRVDMMLLGFLGSNEEAGVYSGQYQIILLLYSISAIIFSVVFPDLYRHSHNHTYIQRRFERIARYLNILAWIVTPCLLLYPKDIMVAMGGEPFATGYEGLRVLSFMIPLYISAIALNFLTALDNLKTRIHCEFVALVITVIGGIVAIPIFSVVGMAFVAVVAYAVSGAGALVVLVKRHRIDWRPVARDFIRIGVSVIPAMLVFLMPLASWWLKSLAFALMSLASLTMFRFWDAHDKILFHEARQLLRFSR